MECFRDSYSSFQPLDLQLHDSCLPPVRQWCLIPRRLNFLPELIVTPLGLFGSRVEAILFCPDHVAWLSVSLDPLSQSHRGPEGTQKTPERSGDSQKGLLGTPPKGRQNGHDISALSPALAGLSISCPRHSLALMTRKQGVLTWTATNCVSFGKTLHLQVSCSPSVKRRI